MTFGEAQGGDAVLVWPEVVGYVGLTGPNTAAGEPSAELSCPCRRESAFGRHRATGARGKVLEVGT